MTVILGSIIVGLLYLLALFIPPVRSLTSFISGVTSNPAVAIVLSIIFILIASLFLLSDFEAIRQAVNNRLPKQYEWGLAYGLAYTVLYLYIKILDLLITIFGNKK